MLNPDQCCELFVGAILEGDDEKASDLVQDLLQDKWSLIRIYLEVFSPALSHVGRLWEEGKVNVAQEHMATQITIRQMEKLRFQQRLPKLSHLRVMVGCVEGERHHVGSMMMADLFRVEGYAVDYLGADVPTKDLVEMVKIRRPDLLGISVTLDSNLSKAAALMELVSELTKCPKVVVGGSAVQRASARLSGEETFRYARDAMEGLKISRNLLGLEGSRLKLDAYLRELGERMRELRKRRGWTQQQLATAAGLTRAYIVSVEAGKQNLSIGVVIRIANALEVPLKDLLLAGEANFQREIMNHARQE